MVSVLCYHCQSDQLVKNGFSSQNKQRYLCSSCERRSTADPDAGLTPGKEAEILRLLNERMSHRGIARALKVSRQSIVAIIKKNDEALLAQKEKNGVRYLERTLLPAQDEEILELDAGALWADGASLAAKRNPCGFGLLCAVARGKLSVGGMGHAMPLAVAGCGRASPTATKAA